MKKKNLKNLSLKKEMVSKLDGKFVTGGVVPIAGDSTKGYWVCAPEVSLIFECGWSHGWDDYKATHGPC